MTNEIISLNEGEEYIRLCDMMKLSGEFETGGQAKIAIQNGEVEVNGEICTMRGKKMRKGDMAGYRGKVFEVR